MVPWVREAEDMAPARAETFVLKGHFGGLI